MSGNDFRGPSEHQFTARSSIRNMRVIFATLDVDFDRMPIWGQRIIDYYEVSRVRALNVDRGIETVRPIGGKQGVKSRKPLSWDFTGLLHGAS
ncbi:hypothetical protein Bxe_B0502 [Paraburkholderia xenovorans LB400]|uniref:Uncharacterized protein n=1 Tax=Paraburkholderia xenovorans (strain LB400) TaxID=266265 RepID=Q13KE4_PARXL|nr:hypothetical protein Bxe_B0502 [Paraburkholderia xenovorans LB400]